MKPVSGSDGVESTISLSTKSPSITCAASGSFLNARVTDVGKSASSAPEVPPAMLSLWPTTFAISASASFTDWSVHGISCSASWSYFSSPAWRR